MEFGGIGGIYEDFEITLTEPNDFKQSNDVSSWLDTYLISRNENVFTKEVDNDIVQLPKFVLNKDHTNYFEKEIED